MSRRVRAANRVAPCSWKIASASASQRSQGASRPLASSSSPRVRRAIASLHRSCRARCTCRAASSDVWASATRPIRSCVLASARRLNASTVRSPRSRKMASAWLNACSDSTSRPRARCARPIVRRVRAVPRRCRLCGRPPEPPPTRRRPPRSDPVRGVPSRGCVASGRAPDRRRAPGPVRRISEKVLCLRQVALVTARQPERDQAGRFPPLIPRSRNRVTASERCRRASANWSCSYRRCPRAATRTASPCVSADLRAAWRPTLWTRFQRSSTWLSG